MGDTVTDELDALRENVQETLAAEAGESQTPAPKSVTRRVVFRRENEELLPEQDRYIVVQNMNYFPVKNVYTHAETLALFEEGIQVSVRT